MAQAADAYQCLRDLRGDRRDGMHFASTIWLDESYGSTVSVTNTDVVKCGSII